MPFDQERKGAGINPWDTDQTPAKAARGAPPRNERPAWERDGDHRPEHAARPFQGQYDPDDDSTRPNAGKDGQTYIGEDGHRYYDLPAAPEHTYWMGTDVAPYKDGPMGMWAAMASGWGNMMDMFAPGFSQMMGPFLPQHLDAQEARRLDLDRHEEILANGHRLPLDDGRGLMDE